MLKKSATYCIQGFVNQIDGEDYRFVVVHSSSLDKALDTAAVSQAYDNARTFVLISSVPSERASDAELLKIYKDQPKIETRFKFLKYSYYEGAVFFRKARKNGLRRSIMCCYWRYYYIRF